MTARALNLSWVSNQLALGGSFLQDDIAVLAREHCVRHVVDLRAEQQDEAAHLQPHGIELLLLPTRDLHAVSLSMVQLGVAWVSQRLMRKERVYIHCEHGIGRSILLGLCVLTKQGMPPLDALAAIKRSRPCASPSPDQLHAYLEWLGHETIEAPSWHELAAIAYATCLHPDQTEARA